MYVLYNLNSYLQAVIRVYFKIKQQIILVKSK